MLPSMPLLMMTPQKELNDDSSDTSDDDSFPHQPGESEPSDKSLISEPQDPHQLQSNGQSAGSQEDNDKGGTTIYSPEKRVSSVPSSQKKKKKKQHLKTLEALTPNSGISLEKSAHNYAEMYLQKVKRQLDEEKFNQFLQELVEFEAIAEKRPVDLYRRMEQTLSAHPQLVEEFLGFLKPEQALEVNQFIPYLQLSKMKEFFRKLNILMMKRQSRQILAVLEGLAVRSEVTLAEVKAAILPLLKTSPLLTNHFLELLPRERPPDSLMTDFEKVDLKDDSLFETVVIPDCPDPYGNDNCVCPCHAGQKLRHCIKCGIKYVNGRVYLQYGKVLRPARVSFKAHKHADLHKWEGDKYRPRRRFLPKSMLSPTGMDLRLNVDSEDDCGVKRSPRTPRVRATRPKVCKKTSNENKEEEALQGIFPLTESHNVASDNPLGGLVVDCKMDQDGNDDQEFDEVVIDGDCNTEEEDDEDPKCLHSENESSIEGEDIGKDLESGMDFSFEDEEGFDIDCTEVTPNEKNNLEDNFHDLSNDGFPMSTLTNNLDSHHIETNISSSNMNQDVADEKDTVNILQVSTLSQNPSNSDSCSKGNCVKEEYVTENREITTNFTTNTLSANQSQGSSEPHLESSGSLDSSYKEWTREEDKIILQTIESESSLGEPFEAVKLQLPNRSKEEIQTRFAFVLKLLKEMISDKSK